MTAPNPQAAGKHVPTAADYVQTLDSKEFISLRSTFRNFAFPLTVIGLVWFLVYVLVATYQPDFMAQELPVVGNVGFLIGLLQFVTTFLITWLYVRFANTKLEPAQAAIRKSLEG